MASSSWACRSLIWARFCEDCTRTHHRGVSLLHITGQLEPTVPSYLSKVICHALYMISLNGAHFLYVHVKYTNDWNIRSVVLRNFALFIKMDYILFILLMHTVWYTIKKPACREHTKEVGNIHYTLWLYAILVIYLIAHCKPFSYWQTSNLMVC